MQDYEKLKKTYMEFISTMNERNDIKPVQKLIVELKLVNNLKQKACEFELTDEITGATARADELTQRLLMLGVTIN